MESKQDNQPTLHDIRTPAPITALFSYVWCAGQSEVETEQLEMLSYYLNHPFSPHLKIANSFVPTLPSYLGDYYLPGLPTTISSVTVLSTTYHTYWFSGQMKQKSKIVSSNRTRMSLFSMHTSCFVHDVTRVISFLTGST